MFELKDGNLILRQITQEDILPIASELKQTYFKDKDLHKIISFLKSKARMGPYFQTSGELFLTISYEGECAGLISLENYASEFKDASINCFIIREFLSKGISRKATLLFMKYLFVDCSLNQLNLYIDKKVTGPIPLFRELGFKKKFYLNLKKNLYVITRKTYLDKYC